MKPIPYARQDIDDDDIKAVVETLRSDWLTQGPAIERFERAVADYCGVRYAVAVNSGTSALHIACRALGLEPGQRLWTSPNTFVASANCALYCGAGVDFVDIDPRTYNLSVDQLEAKLATAKSPPQIVVPVHLAGQPCEMDRIKALAEHHRFAIIEDASHAIGSRYKNSRIGDCRWSDLAVLSFHPAKIITSGEGGMVLTSREDLYRKLLVLRTHGITRDAPQMQEHSHGPWYYEQTELGYNYRMTDIHAALGTNQLKRIDRFVERRRELACRYDNLLTKLPVMLPWQDPEGYSSFHLYIIRLKLDRIAKTHRQVFDALRATGIQVNLHYMPVHLQPYYRKLGFKPGDFPEAELYSREAITLPLYYGLSEADQDRVVATLTKILS